MTWFEQAKERFGDEWAATVKREILKTIMNPYFNGLVTVKNKEENTMKVSYNGVTGELIKLERSDVKFSCYNGTAQAYKWTLDIWDDEKGCKVSFPAVVLKDVKFLGGEVTYG